MGKKYIIELEDKPFHKGNGDFLYRVKGFNSLVFDMTGIGKLTPYTELDLEQVRKEAYAEGYKEGMQLSIDDAKLKDEYKHGLSDAWETARKIWEYDTTTLREIFGEGIMRMDWFMKFTASEAIKKIRQYEQRQEDIQLWDEVINGRNFKGTVTYIADDGMLTIFCQDGTWINSHARFWKKTGRHFPEIAAVLEKLKEN